MGVSDLLLHSDYIDYTYVKIFHWLKLTAGYCQVGYVYIYYFTMYNCGMFVCLFICLFVMGTMVCLCFKGEYDKYFGKSHVAPALSTSRGNIQYSDWCILVGYIANIALYVIVRKY